jgi:hypothetical protein
MTGSPATNANAVIASTQSSLAEAYLAKMRFRAPKASPNWINIDPMLYDNWGRRIFFLFFKKFRRRIAAIIST